MRQQWIPLFLCVLTILLLNCLLDVEGAEAGKQEWSEDQKEAWFQNQENMKKAVDAKKKHEDDEKAKDTMKLLYYGAIGGGAVSTIINLVFFILAWKGCICKPKPTEVHRTLDVL